MRASFKAACRGGLRPPLQSCCAKPLEASKLEGSRAFADAVDPGAEHVSYAKPDIGYRSPLGSNDEAVALDSPASAAEHRKRQRVGIVRLPIAHTRSERDQRMVEDGAVG